MIDVGEGAICAKASPALSTWQSPPGRDHPPLPRATRLEKLHKRADDRAQGGLPLLAAVQAFNVGDARQPFSANSEGPEKVDLVESE